MAFSSATKSLPLFSMQGKVCVVTGAVRGLGYEFCRAFVQSGCTSLAILDLKESEAQNAAAELVASSCLDGDLKPQNFNIIGLSCDVTSEEAVQKAFVTIIATFGRVDTVVASAGIVDVYPALDYPTERIKHLYDVNVHGVFFTAREAARHMIPQGSGSIILVASISASIANIPQSQTPYNTSKAAVKNMASSLAVEWAKTGIRVNALSPGYMLTKLTKTALLEHPEVKKIWEDLTPMGRIGDPEDLAGAIVYLASDASKYMTGSELRVDGGYCSI